MFSLVSAAGKEVARYGLKCPDKAKMFTFMSAVNETFKNGLLHGVDAPDLKVFKSREEFDSDNTQPLDCLYPLKELGAEEELIVQIPVRRLWSAPSADVRPFAQIADEAQIPVRAPSVDVKNFAPVEVAYHGLSTDTPHLAREQLLRQIYEELYSNGNRFVLLASPSGSGKSSLLLLFAERFPRLHWVDVSYYGGETAPASDELRMAGIDVYAKTMKVNDNEAYIVTINDGPSWLPRNVYFIISAHHALKPGADSPAEFKSLVTFG